MSDIKHRNEVENRDKGNSLELMSAMGFSCEESKKALEECDWDAERAISGLLNTEDTERASKMMTKKDKATSGNTSGPQFSPDSEDARTSLKAYEGNTNDTRDTTSANVYTSAAIQGALRDYANVGVSASIRMPGAFREGLRNDDDTISAWDSQAQSYGNNVDARQEQTPYLAVAETVSEPELVHATRLQHIHHDEPASPPDPQNFESSDTATHQEDKRSSLLTRWQVLGILILICILLFTGLAVGLAVWKTRSESGGFDNVVEGSNPNDTMSPSPATTSAPTLFAGEDEVETGKPNETLAPSVASPTVEPISGQTPSPTRLPTSTPTRVPTTVPSESTVAPVLAPTTFPPIPAPTTAAPVSTPPMTPPTTTNPPPVVVPTLPPTSPPTRLPPIDPPSSTPPPTVVPTFGAPPITAPPVTTTIAPSASFTEAVQVLGTFTDAQEGVEPDLIELKVSIVLEYQKVFFDVTFVFTDIQDSTFFVFLRDATTTLHRLEMDTIGNWRQSRSDNDGNSFDVNIASGNDGVLVGIQDSAWTASVPVDLASIPFLAQDAGVELWVTSEASGDRMPNESDTPSFYTLA